jgi:enterochelin esterase-like enzyme
MRHTLVAWMMVPVLWGQAGGAQPPATSAEPNDFKPASTNIVGLQYPQVNSARQVKFRIYAPDANSIRVLGTTLAKGADGYFTGVTRPQDPGFHYYTLNVNGAEAADPASESFFGAGFVHSGIEIPDQGVDFYDIKDVPHGEIRSHWYLAKSTNQMRQANIYTPPGYDKDLDKRYPVLYLQHGMSEDRRAWANQGRTNFILDNLIAGGKARPMIVVIEDGGISSWNGAAGRGGRGGAGGFGAGTRGRGMGAQPPQRGDANAPARGAAAGGRGGRAGGFGGGGRGMGSMMGGDFTAVMVNDIIPMVDATYRTIPDREHRAMAGLSLGGAQTYTITQAHLDKFAYIGTFSPPFGMPALETGYNGLLAKPDEFAKQVKVLFLSLGTKEQGGNRTFHQQLEKAGVKHAFYDAPGTAHEFQTWRKSLYEFAQLLFKN